MKPQFLSIVIPVYNEEAIIESNLGKVAAFLKTKKYSAEIVVVDDGSADSTQSAISGFEKKCKPKNFRLITQKKNLGKGAAVRTGMLKAKGKYIVFMDADLSVPLRFVDELVDALSQSEVAIGSRRTKGARIKKHQPFIRETMGRVFTKLTQLVVGSRVVDFTCGFKGFRSEAARSIFGKSAIDRWAYDAEIIFLAEKLGYKITQVPVAWVNRADTRVKVGRATAESLVDLFRIRIRNAMGGYD